MNCLILLVLLFCCGNNNGRNCGCESNKERESDCGCGNRNSRERENDCGCGNNREREGDRGCGNSRNDDCGCRSDVRPEPRLEPRPFISFSGQGTCGCESNQSDN